MFQAHRISKAFTLKQTKYNFTSCFQAEVLYKLVEDCARLRGDGSEIVVDLFCGTGSIGLSLAKRYSLLVELHSCFQQESKKKVLFVLRVKHVYGFEVVAEAVSDAQRNAKLNGIQNATFVQGDLNKISDSFGKDFPKPDIVITGIALVYSCFLSFWVKFVSFSCYEKLIP